MKTSILRLGFGLGLGLGLSLWLLLWLGLVLGLVWNKNCKVLQETVL